MARETSILPILQAPAPEDFFHIVDASEANVMLRDKKVTLQKINDFLVQFGGYVTVAYVDNALTNINALPAQTNQGGKFLATDGTVASWQPIPTTLSAGNGISIANAQISVDLSSYYKPNSAISLQTDSAFVVNATSVANITSSQGINFQGGNNTFSINIFSGFLFAGGPASYASNYATSFTARSFVDKGYVDAAITTASVTDARILNQALTGLGSLTGAITSTDSIVQAFGKMLNFQQNIQTSVRTTLATGLDVNLPGELAATDNIVQVTSLMTAHKTSLK